MASRRVAAVVAMVLCATAAPTVADAAKGSTQASLPIAPGLLVPSRLHVPGFSHARRRIVATDSATSWARELVGDSPVEEVVEVGRLGAEGFAEAVLGLYQVGGRAEGYAAALVLGSAAFAQTETREKIREETLGFGPGTTDVAVKGLTGGTLVEQPHGLLPPVRGARLVSVIFAEGRCVLAVGAPLAHGVARSRARGSLLAAARALDRRAVGVCFAPAAA